VSTKDNAPDPINVGTEYRTGAEGSTGSGKHTTSVTSIDGLSLVPSPEPMPKRLPVHPVALAFPEMPEEQFQALKADIRDNGQQECVITFNGQVIDGRHRARACAELGIDCLTREFEGDEENLQRLVNSLNGFRRHLTQGQWARFMADAVNTRQGERTDLEHSANLQKVSQERAAEIGGISPRLMAHAVKVKEHAAPELDHAVKTGAVSVSAAAMVAELPKAEQKKIVKSGKVKETAAAIRKGTKPVKVAKPDASQADKSMMRAISRFAGASEDADPEDFATRFGAIVLTVERVRRSREWASRFLDKVSRITTDTDDIYESELEQLRGQCRELVADNEGLMADSARLAELQKIVDENEPLKVALAEIDGLKRELKLMTESRNRQQTNASDAIQQRDDKGKHIAVLKKNIAKLEKQIKS